MKPGEQSPDSLSSLPQAPDLLPIGQIQPNAREPGRQFSKSVQFSL